VSLVARISGVPRDLGTDTLFFAFTKRAVL
jgi:hypothetical protein